MKLNVGRLMLCMLLFVVLIIMPFEVSAYNIRQHVEQSTSNEEHTPSDALPHSSTFPFRSGKLITFPETTRLKGWITYAVPILLTFAVWTCGHCLTQQPRTSAYLGAFGFARFLAAVHIVLFHCFKKDAPFDLGYDWEWMSYGYVWVPFFFMMSGFSMTYSRYVRLDAAVPESTYNTWKNGMIRIYPAYLLSMIVSIGFSRFDFALWRTVPARLLLVQTWGLHYICTPTSWICVTGINEPAWFISTLHFYYLVFQWLYRWVTSCSSRMLVFIIFCCWTFDPIMNEIVISKILQSSHPVLSIHQFVFGMCLCRLFVDSCCSPSLSSSKKLVDEAKIDRIRPFGQVFVLFPYVFLILFFSNPFAFHRVVKHLALMLAFGTLIFGLALEVDPIACLFKKQPFIWGDHVSYEVYILQQAIIPLVPLMLNTLGLDDKWSSAGYVCLLVGLALLAHNLGCLITTKKQLKSESSQLRNMKFDTT